MEENTLQAKFVNGNLKSSSYKPVILKRGVKPDYKKSERNSVRVGRAGENYIVEVENEKLKNLGFSLKANWVSQNEGDGLGYDILSYDENKREIYIEVKTTKGSEGDRFYITSTELAACKQYGNRYYLYRLFDFNASNKIAVYRGEEVVKLCNTPYQYAVEG